MNMKENPRVNVLLLTTVMVMISGCAPKKQPEQTSNLIEANKAIAESNAIYFESFAKNDSSIFISRYAEDCCIMLPNAPAMCGPDAALKFFRMAYDKGLRNGKFITTEVYEAGKEFVIEVGNWQSFDAGNTMVDDGKFLVLWKKPGKAGKCSGILLAAIISAPTNFYFTYRQTLALTGIKNSGLYPCCCIFRLLSCVCFNFR